MDKEFILLSKLEEEEDKDKALTEEQTKAFANEKKKKERQHPADDEYIQKKSTHGRQRAAPGMRMSVPKFKRDRTNNM